MPQFYLLFRGKIHFKYKKNQVQLCGGGLQLNSADKITLSGLFLCFRIQPNHTSLAQYIIILSFFPLIILIDPLLAFLCHQRHKKQAKPKLSYSYGYIVCFCFTIFTSVSFFCLKLRPKLFAKLFFYQIALAKKTFIFACY